MKAEPKEQPLTKAEEALLQSTAIACKGLVESSGGEMDQEIEAQLHAAFHSIPLKVRKHLGRLLYANWCAADPDGYDRYDHAEMMWSLNQKKGDRLSRRASTQKLTRELLAGGDGETTKSTFSDSLSPKRADGLIKLFRRLQSEKDTGEKL